MFRILKHLFLAFGYGILTAMLILIGIYIYYLENRSDLKPWHQVRLDAEFRAEMVDKIKTLDDYRDLEEQLFKQLDQQVSLQLEDEDRTPLNRYNPDGLTNPSKYPGDWNRTFELPADKPKAGVLLLHGLSDSPYSMRSLGQMLNKQGDWVVGLRIPGHGTAPSGLLDISWHDFTAAVRIAARHIQRKIGPDTPLYIIGYSNGAALAVEYSLSVLEGEDLPKVDALVLLSPAIDVTPVAAFAIWQARLSRLFGLEKLLWSDIQPEFDPYKYNSFTVNAGDQIYQLTQNIAERIKRLDGPEGIKGFPDTLAFVSVVDATIPPATLIDALFSKLPKANNQLVLFDINRHTESVLLLRSDPEILTNRLLKSETLPFDLSLLTNANASTNDVVAWRKPAGRKKAIKQALEQGWPEKLFSLSHLALPFPMNDPIYGGLEHTDDKKINLGNVSIRGERNILQIPDNYFIRLRYNPFFDYLQLRILEFLDTENKRADQ